MSEQKFGTMPGRPLPTARHLPVNTSNDTGEILRERCNETCGVPVVGRDLSQVRADIERLGGPEAILDRAVKRIERGQ